MATKSACPAGHGPNDFECFGPPAMNDGEFETCKIADLGSFCQETSDSNKFYHAAVVKSKINGKWYTYFEWGRVGANNPQFQFLEWASEANAQLAFAKQCHSKNDKRGEWTDIAGIRTLTAKPGKDVYLVRQLTTRSTGLPDAKTIKYIDPNKVTTNVTANESIKKIALKRQVDPQTDSLLRDLIGGTIKYTRSSMADNSIPTQTAIDQARTIIFEAQKRLVVVGSDIANQIQDKDLRAYSSELYRRIPKIKKVRTPDAEWILSQNNLLLWQQDLDTFESALAGELQQETETSDPFYGLPLHMEWIDPKSELGKFLYYWWPKASANKHSYLKEMKIKNLWKIDRHGDEEIFHNTQNKIAKDLNGKKPCEQPLFQPSERHDVDSKYQDLYKQSNTALLFHGTRSCNTSGILRSNFLLPKQLSGVSIAGAMYGSLHYEADDWKKSAGYTSLRNSMYGSGGGGIAGREAFMFACDVILGEPHVAPKPHPYTSPPKGTHSIFGMGRVHGKKHNSGVENNEWIVSEICQTKIRYLAEFAA